MSQSIENQALALAAIFQSTHQVKLLARQGESDSEAFACLLRSLLKLDADTVEDIYGSTQGLHDGLSILRQQIRGSSQQRDLEVTRYAATLMHLERKLIQNQPMLDRIRRGIQAAQEQLEHFEPIHENMIARLAGLYSDTISTLHPRVMVNGNPDYLANSHTAAKIRVLLFAGIRSAVLWRQCGGNRWRLLFSRSQMIKTVDELLRVTTH